MEYVPELFIKSVLCISSLPDVELFRKQSFRSWSHLAADQMKRRKDWRLYIDNSENEFLGISENENLEISENEHFGYLENECEDPCVFASFEEFAAKDPALHQIAGISFITPYRMILRNEDDEDKIASKWTKIATEQDVESFKSRFFPRINYGAMDCLELGGTDSMGLRSAIFRHLFDKNLRIRNLELSYKGPASTRFLKEQVQKQVVHRVAIHGKWPLESTVPLIEALIPQRQLRWFDCSAKMPLSKSFFDSLFDDWKKDDSPERKDLSFRNQKQPVDSGYYSHPISWPLEVTVTSFSTELSF